jgi:hypothetical protein
MFSSDWWTLLRFLCLASGTSLLRTRKGGEHGATNLGAFEGVISLRTIPQVLSFIPPDGAFELASYVIGRYISHHSLSPFCRSATPIPPRGLHCCFVGCDEGMLSYGL